MAAASWWSFKRVAANGRWEVTCDKCGNFFWLNVKEVLSWRACPHCLNWWVL